MLSPKDMKAAAYNPRSFTTEAEAALSKSMETFSDISGITFNERTGNIVGGHHRWDNLVNDHGIDGLKFKKIKGTDRLLINTKKGEFTGYLLRVVDWDEAKEKAANVTANSSAVEGEFTSDLQEILMEIRDDFDDTLFEELRLDTMEVNIEPVIVEEEEASTQKSETMISGGGDKYITVKLELSPELSDRLYQSLDRFKDDSGSVEESLATILTYVEHATDKSVLKAKEVKKVVKKAAKKKATKKRQARKRRS